MWIINMVIALLLIWGTTSYLIWKTATIDKKK